MAEVNDQIADLRNNTTLPAEEIGRRLENLYRAKLNPGESQSAEPSDAPDTIDSINEKIQDLRYDAKLSDEKKGEKLDELYKQRLTLEKAAQAQPGDPEVISREAESEVRNQLGSRFDPTMKTIAKVALDVFGGGEQFKTFFDKLALGRDEQVAATLRFANLFESPIENKMSVDEADDIVDEGLRSMWGDRAIERNAAAQKFIRAAFGEP